MKFREYLTEVDANVVNGQAIDAHEPTTEASISISNPKVRAEVNARLIIELNSVILSPQEGVQKTRKILHTFGLDLPALYEPDLDGDEIVFTLTQFDSPDTESFYLYLIYYLTDDGYYDFYTELVDESGLEEIMSDEEEEPD